MKPVRATIVVGHVIDALRSLPAESVHCVITSPPYFGLRDYKTGVWEGGDPNCDHRPRAPETVDKSITSSLLDGGRAQTGHVNEGWPGGVCGRCGAVQVEPTVWGRPRRLGRYCHHAFDDQRVSVERGAGNWQQAENGPGLASGRPQTRFRGDFRAAREHTERGVAVRGACQKCGMWRGALGLEPLHDCLAWARGTPLCNACYVCHMVAVMREIRRVLRPDGTVWLNMGDSYVASPRGNAPDNFSTSSLTNPAYQDSVPRGRGANVPQTKNPGVQYPQQAAHRIGLSRLKTKDLIGMPWRVFFALQADGWYGRSAVVWAKGVSFLPGYSGSVMPESVDDRPTTSYEMVFLLAKSADYFWDGDVIREPYMQGTFDRLGQATFDEQAGGGKDYGLGTNPNRSVRQAAENLRDKLRGAGSLRTPGGQRAQSRARGKTAETPMSSIPLGRNVRSVWVINPEPFDLEMCRVCRTVYDGREYAMLADAPADGDAPPKKRCRCGRSDAWLSHFATFPQALVLPMVLSGTSERGCCPKCNAPWKRIVDAEGGIIGQSWHDHKNDAVVGQRAVNAAKGGAGYRRREVGWEPTCDCGVDESVRATVLDPFCGSGTTLHVGAKNGRNAIGIDLQEDYVPLIRRRLRDLETDLLNPTEVRVVRMSPLEADVEPVLKRS